MSETRVKMPWITEQGLLSQEEAIPKALSFAQEENARYVAFHTDHFSSGWVSSVPGEIKETLLEMRLFTQSAELHLFRTAISSPFQFRIADDNELVHQVEGLDTTDSFLKNPENYSHLALQVLDINEKWPPYQRKEKDQNGCRKLCTTGGGHYSLPLKGDENLVQVINYLSYDNQTGVCTAVDYRIAGFIREKGADEK